MLVAPMAQEADRLYVQPEGEEFFRLVNRYLSEQNRALVKAAFDLARQEHGKQRRKSGELFFTHPLTVAYYLGQYRLDAPTLIAALLHDVAEDTLISISQIEERFGPSVGLLVDGVTKLKEVTAGVARTSRQLSPDEIRDASMHKMFEAMTADVRVVLIKLFDRLHNMRTIAALPSGKQRQKAGETLAVYAPLANRLGIWRIKSELEALSLQVLDRDVYDIISQELEIQFRRQQPTYQEVMTVFRQHLADNGVQVIDIFPNPENIYSVYKGLTVSSAAISSVQTSLRVVVLLNDVPDCYQALGVVHQKWRPIPGKFDDYIALPRENLYQALHTTVIYSSGLPLKVRFRSQTMNELSEIGILARWLYADSPLWHAGLSRRVDMLFKSISDNINLEPQDYSSAVQSVVQDVFRKQVMVYTPRGDVIELPQGATPVDFAYAIHTEIGNQTQRAFVNEQPYPLNKPLEDGDQVRILKSGWARPHRTWLDEDVGYLATNRARSHVRRWFRRLPDELAVIDGKNLLEQEMKMLGVHTVSHDSIAEHFGCETTEHLYHCLGRAEILPTTVATHVLTTDWHREPSRSVGKTIRTKEGQEFVINNGGERKLRLCQSCGPRPGDEIVGFLRSDGQVTVHKTSCFTLRPDPMSNRTIKLSWGKVGEHEVHMVTVQIDVYDRAGLLFEISDLLRNENVNIASIHTAPVEEPGKVRLLLDLEILNPRQLVRILHRAQALVNVFDVRILRTKAANE